MPRGPKGDDQTRRVSSVTHRAPGLLFPIEIGPDISAPLAAGLTGEQRLDVGQPDTIAPAIGADLDGMGALVVTPVTQNPPPIFPKLTFPRRCAPSFPASHHAPK